MNIVNNVRIAEDFLAFVLISIILISLFVAWKNLKKQGQSSVIPITFLVGLLPLYLWKTLGAFRRMFIDKSIYPELYHHLHDIGEVFESLSGLAIALSALIVWYLLVQQRSLDSRE